MAREQPCRFPGMVGKRLLANVKLNVPESACKDCPVVYNVDVSFLHAGTLHRVFWQSEYDGECSLAVSILAMDGTKPASDDRSRMQRT